MPDTDFSRTGLWYSQWILVMEIINPCEPHRLSPVPCCVGRSEGLVLTSWNGGRSTSKCGTRFKNSHECVGVWQKWSPVCTNNLLRYYHDRLAADKEEGKQPDHSFVNNFAMIVFSLHVVSSVIKTYFSKTKYIKNQYRSRLSDSLTTATYIYNNCETTMTFKFWNNLHTCVSIFNKRSSVSRTIWTIYSQNIVRIVYRNRSLMKKSTQFVMTEVMWYLWIGLYQRALLIPSWVR